MSATQNLKLHSTVRADGTLLVDLREEDLPAPAGTQLLVRVEAAPINPSDLGLLFGPADMAGADYADGRIVAQLPEPAMKAMAARIDQPMGVGNEAAGTVIAAGDAPAAQALLGKRVAMIGGDMYARFRLIDASACMVLPDDVSAEQGASAFVNPMTALGFAETARAGGHKAIVHTAAASNLGQMLVKVARADGLGLVNIVRSAEQAATLRDMGAEHVVNSQEADFSTQLEQAIAATGATVAFDAIGGGDLLSRVMNAMERVASRDEPYSRYGSTRFKQGYIYGALDTGPTILHRGFGFSWSVSGWLLFPFLQQAGRETADRMRARVRDNLTTLFASRYKAHLSLEQALTRDAVLAYNARRTGEKYLIVPHG